MASSAIIWACNRVFSICRVFISVRRDKISEPLDLSSEDLSLMSRIVLCKTSYFTQSYLEQSCQRSFSVKMSNEEGPPKSIRDQFERLTFIPLLSLKDLGIVSVFLNKIFIYALGREASQVDEDTRGGYLFEKGGGVVKLDWEYPLSMARGSKLIEFTKRITEGQFSDRNLRCLLTPQFLKVSLRTCLLPGQLKQARKFELFYPANFLAP